MTKDELNVILKDNEMCLHPVGNGTSNKDFYVLCGDSIVAEFNGENFIFSRDDGQGFGKKIVTALIEYANTPVEERKPKPQLYNIIIAEDVVNNESYITAWQKEKKLGDYSTNSYVDQDDLLYDNDFKFTAEEIEDLKSKVSEKQKQIIDIGMKKVEDTMSVGVDISYD